MHTSAARAHALRTSGVTYRGNMEYVSAVRADLRALLPDCPMADDVILCASELAANAALHSHSRLPGGTFTVRATVHPGCLGCPRAPACSVNVCFCPNRSRGDEGLRREWPGRAGLRERAGSRRL